MIGASGSGKSQTLKAIAWELPKQFTEVKIIIVDFHGDLELPNETCYPLDMESPYGINPLVVDLDTKGGGPNLQAIAVAAVLKKALILGANQEGLVISILNSCYQNKSIVQDDFNTWTLTPPTFADVRREIESRVEDGCKESVKLQLKLAATFQYGIFDKPQPALDAQIIRFDLSALGKVPGLSAIAQNPRTNPTPPPAKNNQPLPPAPSASQSVKPASTPQNPTVKPASKPIAPAPIPAASTSDDNPLVPPGASLDELIQRQINDDLWEEMKGDLPCADATTECISQLQAKAGQSNPLLNEVDKRIQEIQVKIDEAKTANRTSIKLSVFEPALQVFLREETIVNATTRQTEKVGFLERLGRLFSSPVPILNELFVAVGIPLLRSFSGGNDQQRNSAIAISDLQVKLAQMQRDRAQLNDTVREKIYLAVFDLDDAKREFQISQEIAKRSAQRMQLIEVEYRLGQNSTNSFLSETSSLDREKASTYRAWTQVRSRLEKVKLLVLGVDGI